MTEEEIIKEIKESAGEKLIDIERQVVEMEEYIKYEPIESTTTNLETTETETESPLPPTPAPVAPNPRLPIYLSELLIQSLLALDSFDIAPEWSEARQFRKAGVKKVQGLLDRVDSVKEGFEIEIKSLI